MSTEQQERVWGAAQPRPRWSGRKTIAAVAVAVGIAAAGGAAIYAATGNDSGAQRGGPGMGGGGPQPPGGFGGMDASLHGEFVVSDGNGGYLTELTQTGKITAISATSVTAASDDGFTGTYTIDASTVVADGRLSDLAKGDTVSVVATKSGAAATATRLVEGGGFPGRGGAGGGFGGRP